MAKDLVKGGTPASRRAARDAARAHGQLPPVTTTPTGGTTPWKPAEPPPGTYDPALDSQVAAADRGLADLRLDTEKSQTRNSNDYLLAQGNLQRTAALGVAGILRTRNLTLDAEFRNYQALAMQQAANERRVGASEGGIAQSLRNRKRNLTRDVSLTASSARIGVGETKAGYERTSGEQAVSFRRGNEDRQQGLTRAERENTFYGQDVGAAKVYQAKQAGWVPDTPPAASLGAFGKDYKIVRAPDGSLRNELLVDKPGIGKKGDQFARAAESPEAKQKRHDAKIAAKRKRKGKGK